MIDSADTKRFEETGQELQVNKNVVSTNDLNIIFSVEEREILSYTFGLNHYIMEILT